MPPEDDLEDFSGADVPEWHNSPEEVEQMAVAYSTRGPGDWVISGPLGGHGIGPGRRFVTAKQAETWAREKYGDRLKGRINEATTNGGNRWAYLIKGKR